ncbi:MAG TPA: DUF5719 family protein [Jiangellaceae bacterium]
MIRPVATALWVPVGVAAVLGIAAFVGPPESVVRERPGQDEPVVRSTLVCPFVGGEARASSHIGVLPMGGAAGEQAGGEAQPVVVEALTGEDQPPEPLFDVAVAGAVTFEEVDTEDPSGYAVRAVGNLAPGLAAEQSMLAQGPDLRGLVTGRCAGPARDHWFVGGSGVVGRRGRLVLSNPTSVPAVVDVSVWDESGPVDAPATEDIAVPARGQQILLLDALDPGAERVSVRVNAIQGRVAAALEVRETAGLDPQGVTFVPAAAEPSTDVVVPGVPGHGTRTLQIVAPGDTDAIVSLRLLGPEGPFSPVDQSVVTVSGGTVLEVPISDAAGDAPISVALESDVPVTAAVRVVDAPSDALPELAYTAATEPLAGAAPTLLGQSGSDLTTRLLVGAVGSTPARVQVWTLAADGTAGEPQMVDVPGGSTVPIEVEATGESHWLTVVVEPAEAGTVVVTREIIGGDDDGALLDLLPLVAPSVSVQVPEVAGELPTGLAPAGPITR